MEKCFENSIDEDVLSAERIKKYTDVNVIVLESVDSTNTYLKKNHNNFPENTVVLARKQTNGKGRMGRTFISPNHGIYMSILVKPRMPAEKALSLTTMCAVAVAKAIEGITKEKVRIKWVNDIFVNDRKVCGILTESGINAENSTLDYAVVGIGINVYKPEDGLDDSIKNIAGYLFETPNNIINILAANVINNFFEYFNGKDYIQEYRSKSYLDGKNIEYVFENETHRGRVIGVDESCGLIVEEKGKTAILRTGEIHILSYDKK